MYLMVHIASKPLSHDFNKGIEFNYVLPLKLIFKNIKNVKREFKN